MLGVPGGMDGPLFGVLAAGLVVGVAVRVGGGGAMLVVMGAVRVHAEAVLVVLVVVLAWLG